MRKTLTLFIFFIPVCIYAQDHFVDSILDNRIISLPSYQSSVISNENLFVKMDYAKSEIADTTGFYKLLHADILSVDLLFSDFPANQTLKPLNKKRLQNLIQLLPFLIQQNGVRWQVFRQTDGKDKESSQNLLHGFMINYRAAPTKEGTEKEIVYLKELVALLPQPVVVVPAKAVPKLHYWDMIYGGDGEQTRFYNDRPIKSIIDNREAKLEPGDFILALTPISANNKRLLNEVERRRYGKKDSIYLVLGPAIKFDTHQKDIAKPTMEVRLPDSTVMKVLTRTKLKQALVVTDVTASMSAYTGQFLYWLGKSELKRNISYVVCFNDGDDMPTEKKQLGNTGGVYGQPFKSVMQVSELMENTMNKGSGGDTPENVCEALIKAIGMCPSCEDVVLVADNWAPARDIELVKQIKKPVKVILCGNLTGIVTDYITIALETGGSLHFMNDDIVDLSPLKEGKSILIKGRNYMTVNGKVQGEYKSN